MQIDIERELSEGYAVQRNVILEDVLSLASRVDVMPSTDGRYAVVQDGPERNSLDASWHQDGLTYLKPPSRVLLYCEAVGRGDVTTDLADVPTALEQIDPDTRETLNRLDRYYVSRSGKDTHHGRLIRNDEEKGMDYFSLCSRGWVRGDLDMTLERMTRAMHALFEAFQPSLVHKWSAGDCLIFDNLRFVHRRFNPTNTPDPARRLIRLWFA
ncbi:MAG: TauD/TfdA family dioxygenase [Erythrobacter sp.]|nr:TauD/TfdA family dioxygenase [Erythrobacter sp.]MBO6530274.1 TauD/TfdA family dioxygenase [Erythrobacter sp.]